VCATLDACCVPFHAQVLFCKLTPEQRLLYIEYLRSYEVRDVLEQKCPAFR
jgi:hypothetical protein